MVTPCTTLESIAWHKKELYLLTGSEAVLQMAQTFSVQKQEDTGNDDWCTCGLWKGFCLYEDGWTSPCATNIVCIIVAIRGITYRFSRYIYTHTYPFSPLAESESKMRDLMVKSSVRVFEECTERIPEFPHDDRLKPVLQLITKRNAGLLSQDTVMS